jgi:hypothetical protein
VALVGEMEAEFLVELAAFVGVGVLEESDDAAEAGEEATEVVFVERRVAGGCVLGDDGSGLRKFFLGRFGPFDVEGGVHAFFDGVEVATEFVLGLVGEDAGSAGFGCFAVEEGGVFEHFGDGVVEVSGAERGEPSVENADEAVFGDEEGAGVVLVAGVFVSVDAAVP